MDAVKGITFNDAKNILLGPDNAATTYLENRTNQALYNKFNPVIQNSFSKVGADQVWANIINKYNTIPLVNPVNPDLTDYVTNEALKGVYTMIAVEEKNIRTQNKFQDNHLAQASICLTGLNVKQINDCPNTGANFIIALTSLSVNLSSAESTFAKKIHEDAEMV